MKQKLQALLANMNEGLVDRDQALKAALLTVLAGENLLLLGPPGTAKSLVSRRIAQHLEGDDDPASNAGSSGHFEYLLTKFSTPEEIFGPLSISELKADRFHRNTAGYLPGTRLAFLDEIFKASSSILNALLTVLNERIFHNGNQVERVPLRSLIAASNEVPTHQEELAALYDRFLMRIFVAPVREDHLHLLFNPVREEHQISVTLSQDDLHAVDAATRQVTIPEPVGIAIREIWAAHKEAFKEDRREYLSDRRLVKLLKLLRVSAVTNQRNIVDLSDLLLLQHCVWNHPDNITKTRELVTSTLRKHSRLIPSDTKSHDVAAPQMIPPRGRIKGFAGCRAVHCFLRHSRPF
jgi:MoxR-like ATPase